MKSGDSRTSRLLMDFFNYEAPATVGHGTEMRRGLLTTDEFMKTMKAEINYPKLYETFTYMG